MDINDCKEYLIRIDERQKEISCDITEMKKKLFGNGHEGIITDIVELKTTMRNMRYGITIGFTITSILIGLFDIFKIF